MNEPHNLDRLRSTQLYRPGSGDFDFTFSTGYWTKSIDRLLALKYSFLPSRFSDRGYLFRGMQSGLQACIADRSFGHFDGDNEMCEVEQIMNVFFLTHEISDAVTASRLHENPEDSGILAFKSGIFNDRLDAGKAAVLAIGDSGLVFGYPLLTERLKLSEVEYIFISAHSTNLISIQKDISEKVIPVEGRSRSGLTAALRDQINRLNIVAATPVKSDIYPCRHKY